MLSEPPAEHVAPDVAMSDDGSFDLAPRKSGANTAPLGSLKRRYDSAMQSSHGSRATTPMSSTSSWPSNLHGPAIKELMERADVDSKSAAFLDYDDEPTNCGPESPNKRLKSGVLTPPVPEDLVMASTEKSPVDCAGGVSIKREDADLEMGEIREAAPTAVRDTNVDPGVDQKYAYDALDEMILEAQKNAGAC